MQSVTKADASQVDICGDALCHSVKAGMDDNVMLAQTLAAGRASTSDSM